MRTLAPIRVRREERTEAWRIACRHCGLAPTCTYDWELAIQLALGHLSLKHPQWPSAQLDTDGSGK